MAPLVFRWKGTDIPLELTKVDRSKLYGKTVTETRDSECKLCRLATLAGDGQTLIESGGLASAYMTEDLAWKERGSLKPVDLDGNAVTPVQSSFKEPVELTEEASIDYLLEHNVSSAYLLSPAEEAALPEDLAGLLNEGKIFTFRFSYRGGISADPAFLLQGADGSFWMLVGKPCRVEFVGFEQASGMVESEDESESEDDDLDFSMM